MTWWRFRERQYLKEHMELDKDDNTVVLFLSHPCPQSRALAPLLWLLVMDILLWFLKAMKVLAQAIEGDLAIIIIGQFADTFECKCADNHSGLRVNAKKTG